MLYCCNKIGGFYMEKYDFTPLMGYFFSAIEERNFSEIKNLFEKYPEFDINSTDTSGNTLLHLTLKVVDHNTYPMLQFLLSKGSDPMATNENDKNSFDLAKELGNKGDIAFSILKMHKDQNMRKMLDDLNANRT